MESKTIIFRNILVLLLTACFTLLGWSQPTAIDLYHSSENVDQRNYGNGAINKLIEIDNLVRQGRWEEAVTVADNVIMLWPNWSPAYVKRATLKFRMGRTTEAERDLQRATTLSPNSVALFSGQIAPTGKLRMLVTPDYLTGEGGDAHLIQNLKTQGRLTEAEILLNKLETERTLAHSDLALLMGNLELLREDHFTAIAYYDWGLDRTTSVELLHNRGLARILTYNFSEGCADLEKAARLGHLPSEEQRADLCAF